MKAQQSSRPIFGIAVVAVGLGFLLDALGIVQFSDLASKGWPALIILVGVLSLLSNPRVFLWPSFIIAAGLLLLLDNLGAVDFNVWQIIWPAAIIFTGIGLIFDKFDESKHVSDQQRHDLFAAFSGNTTRSTTDDYQGGKLTAVFGGIELDLREADIKDSATIDVFTAFGGIDLRVPETWNVQAGGLPVMGGWDNKAIKPRDKNAPTLVVRGTCIFGGVEIKN